MLNYLEALKVRKLKMKTVKMRLIKNQWSSINTLHIVNNNYHQDWRLLYTFVPNK